MQEGLEFKACLAYLSRCRGEGMRRGRRGREDKGKRWQRDLMSARWRPWYTRPLVWCLLTDTTFATDPQRRTHFASLFHLLFSSLWLTGGWDLGLVFVSQCFKIIYIYMSYHIIYMYIIYHIYHKIDHCN